MIRHKYESTATGTGATITVSTATGFNNDVTTVRPNTIGSVGTNGVYPYVLLDGNNTDWEHGYGRVDGTTFYRDTVVESTNTGSRINLSSNTHTILVPEQTISGSSAPLTFSGSLSTSSFGTITFSLSSSNDGLTEWPGYSAPTTPSSFLTLVSAIPFAKGYKCTLSIDATGAESTFGNIFLDADGNYWGNILAGSIPILNGETTYMSFSSPMLDIQCPFDTSSNTGIFTSYVSVRVEHLGSSSCDYSVDLFVDYFF